MGHLTSRCWDWDILQLDAEIRTPDLSWKAKALALHYPGESFHVSCSCQKCKESYNVFKCPRPQEASYHSVPPVSITMSLFHDATSSYVFTAASAKKLWWIYRKIFHLLYKTYFSALWGDYVNVYFFIFYLCIQQWFYMFVFFLHICNFSVFVFIFISGCLTVDIWQNVKILYSAHCQVKIILQETMPIPFLQRFLLLLWS